MFIFAVKIYPQNKLSWKKEKLTLLFPAMEGERSEVLTLSSCRGGATEPHNLHLPYLTDCILPHDIAVDAAALALQNSGVRCMVMPPVPFGAHNPGQRELPFCIHTRYSTQQAILEDIVASLYAQGMRKLIILSGHGGNNFKGMIRDLAFVYPDF